MSRMSILCLMTIALAVFTGSLWAQAQMPAATGGSSTISGTVTSWSASSVVVEIAEGNEMTFVVDSPSVLPSDITVGSRIDVSYETLSDGSHRASSVSLYDGNPTSAGAASPGSSTGREPGSVTEQGDEALPQTASSRPLVALVGVLMLSVAAGAWLLSRRTA